jgi:hypothetical protein
MESVFKLEEWRKRLEVQVPDLVTRELGQKIYKGMDLALKSIPSGDTLVIDFSGIRVVDTSFADETVLRLLKELVERKYEERFLCLFNPSESTIANLQGAIARKRLRLAFFALFPQKKWQCVGRYDVSDFPDDQIEPLLQETLRLVVDRERLTARELALKEKIELNNASTRLKKLHDARLVRREEIISEEGKSYVYEPIAQLRQ